MTLPPDILRTLKELARRVVNLETTPQPPNIMLGETVSATFSIAASGVAGDIIEIVVTLTDDAAGRVLATPHFSLYKNNTQSSANLWPLGSSWTDAERRGLRATNFYDWGGTDNNNVVYKILLINGHSSGFTDLLFKMNFRYMSRGVNAS
jgi:hypothetical protein